MEVHSNCNCSPYTLGFDLSYTFIPYAFSNDGDNFKPIIG
jgi:hypothetical protein